MPSGGLKTIAETGLHSFGFVFLVLKYHIFYGKSDFNTMSENKKKTTKQNNISHAEQKKTQKGVPNHSTYVYVKVVN